MEGMTTYEYMTNLNLYLNLCLSAVDCTLGCSTLVYLVLLAQPAVFNTHCGTEFITPRNPGIHSVMPNPAPMAAIFSELGRTHKHEVLSFNEYHAVNRACKKVIRKLIPEKLYKSLSSLIIGLVKVTSLEILIHLITEYAELEEEDVQDIDSEDERSYLCRNSIWRVRRVKKYHTFNCACKKVIRKLIPEKFYKYLSSRIIGLVKVTSLEILIHLITKYVELEEEDVQDIDLEDERSYLCQNSIWRVRRAN